MSSNRFDHEFTVPVISSASMDISHENTLANFRNFFNDEINLTGDWRVALGEIIFPTKIEHIVNEVMQIWLRSVSGDLRNHKTAQLDLTSFHDPTMENN